MSVSETSLLVAARSGDQQAFAALIEPYRRELLVHCYRLLGSLHDAEDLVQETLLRSWRRLASFEGRASFRAWLYKIATHACLDALDSQARRALPGALSLPSEATSKRQAEQRWLEPFPDALLAGVESDPAARYDLHESISLAFLTLLQTLPPRQRAVLLLRDVLGWQASETARLLDLTVSAVNSALHRARTTLARPNAQQRMVDQVPLPADTTTRTLLEQYLRAWEHDDLAGLIVLLKEDATLSMPPLPLQLRGRDAIRAFLAAEVFSSAVPERWRLRMTRANGQPALGLYRRDEAKGPFHAFAVQLLRLDNNWITELVSFLDPTLFVYFELPHALVDA
jgi:RNA polymerase sigma-70 factor (ECF subfamily)